MFPGSVSFYFGGYLEFGKSADQKGAMLDWVRKVHQEKKLVMPVDMDQKNNYDGFELEEMVRVVRLCTQYLPSQRPKMSEVVQMVAEKWEASQNAVATRSSRANGFSFERYSILPMTLRCWFKQWSYWEQES
ncbi:hypothetical protein V6N11_073516 [Hibiscus sabdariffa]|uniref:Uncharacterized protein n=2 Tax=Hibiscus sabdariffa TaxID=183260 RepID=A0ABR2BLH3_9ROSI